MRGFAAGVTLSSFVWLFGGSASATNPTQSADRFQGTFKHIAFVVRDVHTSARQCANIFNVMVPEVRTIAGLVYPADYQGDRNASIRVANLMLDGLQLDLIEPVGGSSPWRDVLDRRGEGVHHIAFGVNELTRGVASLLGAGGRITLGGQPNAGYAYVDVKALPFTIELEGR